MGRLAVVKLGEGRPGMGSKLIARIARMLRWLGRGKDKVIGKNRGMGQLVTRFSTLRWRKSLIIGAMGRWRSLSKRRWRA